MPDILVYGMSNNEFTKIAKLLDSASYKDDISLIYAKEADNPTPRNLATFKEEYFLHIRASKQWLRKNGKDLWIRLKSDYALEWSYIDWSPRGSEKCPTWD